MSVDRNWLLQPANAIEAGIAYVAKQAKVTSLDPPLVAAAYNAGRLKHQDGGQNRWKLRQYPIGTGKHCDRFVQFFNDAAAVLKNHPKAPAMTIADVLDGAAPPKSSPPAAATANRRGPVIAFAENAKASDVTEHSIGVVQDILRSANIERVLVSSTARSPYDQARVMYDNCERHGAEAQRKLYSRVGDKVIDTYEQAKAQGRTPAQIREAMETKIKELGPTNVSRHASDPKVLNVFDIAPSSVKDKVGFERAVKADERVSYFLVPPVDPGYHLEIPQPR
jgi:hypothetical protein